MVPLQPKLLRRRNQRSPPNLVPVMLPLEFSRVMTCPESPKKLGHRMSTTRGLMGTPSKRKMEVFFGFYFTCFSLPKMIWLLLNGSNLLSVQI